MRQIVQFIEDNNISEEEVAKAAHMSLPNFRRQIHSENRTQPRDNVKIKFTKMDRLFFTNLDRII